jgi:hypothetical protein
LEQQSQEAQARAEQERAKQEVLRQEQARSLLVNSIGPEPAPGSDVAELVIRMPDGSRRPRRFMRSDTLRQLHLYISSLEDTPKEFEVLTSYPAVILQATDESMEAAGLHPKAIVLVRGS